MSKAAPAVLPGTPPSEVEVKKPDKLEEKPNSRGLPSGQIWVSPDLIPSTSAASEEFLSEDSTSEEPLEGEALNDFLLSFFSMFKTPTDKQIQLLAEAVEMSYEELEKAVYRLTSSMVQNADEDEIETQDL
jgi:hypothetical protein